MVVSSTDRARVQELLPGEPIRYLFPAVIPDSVSGHVYVAVTARSIVVLSTRFRGRSRPRAVLARYPRATRLGPVDRHAPPAFRLGGVLFEVDEEDLAVVSAVDADLQGDDALPPDPLPDL